MPKPLTPDAPWRMLRLGQCVTALLALAGGALLLDGNQGPGGALLAAAALLAVFGAWWMRRSLERSLRHAQTLDLALLQSQKMAEIGQLASGVAHEINNPLAIIGQEAELVLLLLGNENPAGHGPDIRDSLRQILIQVARGGDITRKLLDFSRPREALKQPWDLNRLVEDMVLLVERDDRLLNVEVVRRYEPALPPVLTDGPLLRQVLLNLLNNAAQVIQDRQRNDTPPRIVVTTRRTDDTDAGLFEIRVQDTGDGIAPEHLPRLFTPFFTTKAPGQGTGLGLALCRRMLEGLGGSIDAQSVPGQGATFRVLLPTSPPVPILDPPSPVSNPRP